MASRASDAWRDAIAREAFDGAEKHLAAKSAEAAGAVAAALPLAAARSGAGAAGRGHHAGSDRGRDQGRQGQLYTAMEIAVAEQYCQDLRGEISGHLGQGRALGRGACLLAHRAGVCLAHLQRRRRQHDGCRARAGLEARWLARTLCAGGRRPSTMPAEYVDPDGTFATHASLFSVIAYNTAAGEAAGRADRLRRPARSQMDGQAGEGASGLLRPDPHRHLRHGARPRLGATSRSSPSRR